MRRGVPLLLLASVCLAFVSACGISGNERPPPNSATPTAGATAPGTSTPGNEATDPQASYIQQISVERQGLGTGEMQVQMPTSGVQGGGDTLTVTIAASAGGESAITVTGTGAASATSTVVATRVPTGGTMDVNVTCTGLTCTAVSNAPQPVASGLSGTWTWNLDYGQAGTGTVQIVADLYQASSNIVLWQSPPLTEPIVILATGQQQVDQSLSWLHDTIISVSAVAVALAPIATWLLALRAKRRRRARHAAEHKPEPAEKAADKAAEPKD